MKETVLVTGAASSIGREAVSQLLKNGIAVRAMVHTEDKRSADLASKGAEVILGNFSDFMFMSHAMNKVSAVIFIYPVIPGLVETAAQLIQAALEVGIRNIVNISQRTSAREAVSHSAQAHWLVEQMFDRCGIPVSHLQPTLFTDWLGYFPEAIANGQFITPFGNARYGMIDPSDIGRVAVSVVNDHLPHAGKTYQLYGPEEVNGEEIAGMLSEGLNKKIRYAELTPEQFGDILRGNHQPEFRIQHLTAVGHMFISGKFGGLNDNVEKLTGLQPGSVQQYIQQHLASK